MSRSTQITLLALAALVIAFVATWLTIPGNPSAEVDPPASLFIRGISDQRFHCIDFDGSGSVRECRRYAPISSNLDLNKLEERVRFAFGGAAAVIVLVGLAFGAGRRGKRESA